MTDRSDFPTITTNQPLVIIGAGPVGLAAAAWAMEKDLPVRVLESGNAVGSNVRDWGHIRLFTPWRYLIDSAGLRRLGEIGWAAPPLDDFPTGSEFADIWLDPLAESFGSNIETRTEVLTIQRPKGLAAPFRLTINRKEQIETVTAGAVLDASGTWRTPNFLGDGKPAKGELGAAVQYCAPDVLGRDRETYQARRVLVVGSGHSASNALLDLDQLAQESPETQITWAVRGGSATRLFGGGEEDKLPARGALGTAVRDLISSGKIVLHTDLQIVAITNNEQGSHVIAKDGRVIGPFDAIVAATGQEADHSLSGSLALDLDPTIGAPRKLVPLIDPRIHSCGTVPPHGHTVLQHPEVGFYIIGAKSYGSAPTFLMATGYEQARSIIAALAGDWAAANDVRLVLPETGVCSGSDGGQTCCGDTSAPETSCCALDAAAKRGGASGCGCNIAA